MYRTRRQSLFERIETVLRDEFQVALTRLTVEEPPQVEMGDYALPLAFELARTLRKAPRKIAEELVAAIGMCRDFPASRSPARDISTAGWIAPQPHRGLPKARKTLSAEPTLMCWLSTPASTPTKPRISAICGMPFWATRWCGCCAPRTITVGVQNYIDNTGVQVADVAVALMHLQNLDLGGVQALDAANWPHAASASTTPAGICMRTSRTGMAQMKQRNRRAIQLRLDTLHALEAGG